jgi:hypothetical protein
MLAIFEGEFRRARTTLEAAAAALDHVDSMEIEGAWFAPNDPVAGAHSALGLIRFLQGDRTGAEAAFAQTDDRCAKLGFPHGPFTHCYALSLETMTQIEAGQYDRATELIEEVARRGEQNGFDEWVMIAACNRASMSARTALAAAEADPDTLGVHVQTMTAIVDAWRAAEMKTFLACYDAVLARVQIAAGMMDAARQRVDLALQMADETDIHFYDAELLRVRAHTFDNPHTRHTGLRAAVEMAQTQDTPIFELRAAADDFELLGGPARAALVDALSRFPSDQTWPELARARALLG